MGKLSSISTPGQFGEQVLSVSPDRSVVTASFRQGAQYFEIYIYLFPTRATIKCNAVTEYYDDAFLFDEMIGGFEDHVRKTPGLVLVGGLTPQEYGSVHGLERYNHYFYAIENVFPDRTEHASAIVTGDEGTAELQFSFSLQMDR